MLTGNVYKNGVMIVKTHLQCYSLLPAALATGSMRISGRKDKTVA